MRPCMRGDGDATCGIDAEERSEEGKRGFDEKGLMRDAGVWEEGGEAVKVVLPVWVAWVGMLREECGGAIIFMLG
jgi:hypothetical protein